MANNQHIVLVGAGNVAWHLGQRIRACGFTISCVYSKSEASAAELGLLLDSPSTTVLDEVPTDAALYLLLVPDSKIIEIAASLQQHLSPSALVMHSSGATPAEVLAPYFKHYGVFYPLQTFSKQRALEFTEVPLCLYTAHERDYKKVALIANALVNNVYAVGDQQRAQLHLAAVFVNNFTNYLQYIGQEIAQENQLPGILLKPLLGETIAKLDHLTPAAAQTGPAIRNDAPTMERHLAMLENHPQWAALYRQLSQGIINELT